MAQPPTAPSGAAHAAILAREAGMRITLQAGFPWVAVISLCYAVWSRLQRRSGKPSS